MRRRIPFPISSNALNAIARHISAMNRDNEDFQILDFFFRAQPHLIFFHGISNSIKDFGDASLFYVKGI